MDYEQAFNLVNSELAKHGRPPLVMGELQKRSAFLSLQEYAHMTQRPLEVCIADTVRFQIQGETLELKA